MAYTFPNDGAADDNSWTIDVALPTFMSATPNMTMRLFVLAAGAGACGGATGEMFTGAQVSDVISAGQSISNNTDTYLTATLFDTSDFDTGVADFGAAYWDAANGRFEVPTGADGTFVLSFAADFPVSNAGFCQAQIYVNAAQVAYDAQIIDTSSYGVRLQCVATVALVAGDLVKVRVTQSTGGARVISAINAAAYFFIGRWDKPA